MTEIMSILRVHKKAETAQEAKTLTQASLRIKDPFGFRVFQIANEEFYTDQDRAVSTLCDAFKEVVEEQTNLKVPDASMFKGVFKDYEILLERMSRTADKTTFIQPPIPVNLSGNAINRDVFLQFIVNAEPDKGLKDIVGPYVKDDLDTDYNKGVMHYFMIWHENAHLTGCCEPQADMIGALMCRQAFVDTTFLDIMADFRIIQSLYGDDKVLEKYAWQTGQTLDFAIAMKQEDVDALTEDNMFEIACMEFENHKSAVARAAYSVTELYLQTYGDPKDGISIKKTVPVCEKILELNIFELGSLENAFLERLNIALQRSANPSLYYDADYAATKPAPVHTFPTDVPEFLPAPSAL